MNVPFVDLKTQYLSIKDEINSKIQQVLDSCAFIGGKFAGEFEQNFARYCGADHCVGVGNGTDALHIALRALGIGSGDEVITAANSFIATSEAITLAGAQVVFVDINPETYNINVNQIEAKITDKTRAIIPVHLYGQPADMDPIIDIARKHNLKLIGDAAQAHGSTYKEKKIAQLTDITCYSFYPGKNLGAYGDAGAIVTSSAEWADKARMYANHGRSDKYAHEVEGVNSRMDGFQGAILNVKLKHLDTWSDNRRRNAYFYNEKLKDVTIVTPTEIDDVRAVYHLYIVRIPDGKRERLQAHLKENGIATGIHYPTALPYLEAYKHLGHTESDFPHALKASQEIVSLPMYPELAEEQIDYVVEKIKSFAL
ncbi:MAG: aminotransferase class I/II-fold pyridoxal phosphate-dependent enzyme [Chitinivibrionales bacterium]|nr:aminotransferase class I/II-fold pyridoxal phosphate-dependent enzyme [Chitinivibrionales bacterium]